MLFRQCFFYFYFFSVFFFNSFRPKLFYQYFFECLRKQQLRGIMLNMYVLNLIAFTKLCSLLATFFNTQQTFQRCLNIVARVIWRRYNVEQRRINVVVSFNVDINNVRQRRNNAVILSVEFDNFETTFWIWPFSKMWKAQQNIFELQKKDDLID